MKEKSKVIQKSKLSDLREIHGMTVLSNLGNINGQGQATVQSGALLQGVGCDEWPPC